MEDSDKLAIATLAASRCAALGTHEPADYVEAYSKIEALFRQHREAQGQAAAEKTLNTWRQLAQES